MSVFKKGYEVAKEAAEKQEESRGKKLFTFFIPAATKDHPESEAEVQFLTEEPINFMAHSVMTIRKGKEAYDTVVCYPEGNCPHCSDSQAKPMAAYLLYDKRPFERKDQKGNTTKVEGQVRLYLVGMRIVTQLARLSSRYGLTQFFYNIIRNGKGTDTTYSFEKGDKVARKAIDILTENLPTALKEGFKGDTDAIVTNQLMMMIPSGSRVAKDEEDDDDDVDNHAQKNLIPADDDDDDGRLDVKPAVKSSPKTIFKKREK